MRFSALLLTVMLFCNSVRAQDIELPPSPEPLVELQWSMAFAILIVDECPEYVHAPTNDPKVVAYLDRLVANGIDLRNFNTAYRPPKDFDGDAVKWLFKRSNLADSVAPEAESICDIADMVYQSDMLTGAMLRRRLDGTS
ncbi:MAG: hypothetical protein AAFQ64_07465 [Pseudomonadota bacterium]